MIAIRPKFDSSLELGEVFFLMKTLEVVLLVRNRMLVSLRGGGGELGN
jgi:hypothetical protein